MEGREGLLLRFVRNALPEYKWGGNCFVLTIKYELVFLVNMCSVGSKRK